MDKKILDKETDQQTLAQLIVMILNLVDDCDNHLMSYKSRITWLKMAAQLCEEAAKIIEKENNVCNTKLVLQTSNKEKNRDA